jgi:hypothetical protein
MSYHSKKGDNSLCVVPAVPGLQKEVEANTAEVVEMVIKEVVEMAIKVAVVMAIAAIKVVVAMVAVSAKAEAENVEENKNLLIHVQPCLHRSGSNEYGM